ncbi:branched-chain amino acid permease, partial [Neisseria gonorrhoeae]
MATVGGIKYMTALFCIGKYSGLTKTGT